MQCYSTPRGVCGLFETRISVAAGDIFLWNLVYAAHPYFVHNAGAGTALQHVNPASD